MKRKKKLIIFITVLMVMFALVYVKLLRDTRGERAFSKVTIRVVDEAGIPIKDANVNIGFLLAQNWDKSISKTFHGKSNVNGEYSSTFLGARESGISATKEGYCRSSTRYKREKIQNIFWHPWNPTIELILRKKVNPIPLKAKEISDFELVKTNFCYKYDLFSGDWLEPYGTGKVADLNINFNYEKKDRYNYIWHCIISMGSESDGFSYIDNLKLRTNSMFKLPYNAQEDTYITSKLIYSIEHVNGQATPESTAPLFDNLFFRIRTEKNDNGKIVKRYYGKLTHLDCQFGSTICEGLLSFTYYLNPTPNDRNLEFNTESNLSQNLDRGEKVSNP